MASRGCKIIAIFLVGLILVSSPTVADKFERTEEETDDYTLTPTNSTASFSVTIESAGADSILIWRVSWNAYLNSTVRLTLEHSNYVYRLESFSTSNETIPITTYNKTISLVHVATVNETGWLTYRIRIISEIGDYDSHQGIDMTLIKGSLVNVSARFVGFYTAGTPFIIPFSSIAFIFTILIFWALVRKTRKR